MLSWDDLDTYAWEQEVQPPGNRQGEVVAALRGLAAASPDTGWDASSRVLFAVGNNHAGSYYPVVLKVVPFLGLILRSGGSTARLRTLDVLIDLIGPFEPEVGFDVVALPTGDRRIRDLLREAALDLEDDVVRCQVEAESEEEAVLARELLEVLHD